MLACHQACFPLPTVLDDTYTPFHSDLLVFSATSMHKFRMASIEPFMVQSEPVSVTEQDNSCRVSIIHTHHVHTHRDAQIYRNTSYTYIHTHMHRYVYICLCVTLYTHISVDTCTFGISVPDKFRSPRIKTIFSKFSSSLISCIPN